MSNLTEQWKKGKLEWHKSYYCQNKKGDFCIATLMGTDVLYSKELGGTLNIGYWEVLAPVPSYEEWRELGNKYDSLQERLFAQAPLYAENQQLKELLKECREFFEEENPKDFTVMAERMDELLTKIDEVLK